MRLIDPIELKRSIVVSNIIGDGKTLEELIDEQPDAQTDTGLCTDGFNDGYKQAQADKQLQRMRGKWEMKPDPYGFFDEIPVCSECGCTSKMREVYKFCPNCGADMRGAE